jgi:hypothetical protein
MTTGVDVPLGLMLNSVQSHLNSLVQVEAGVHLPPFCLVTQDLPPMSLDRLKAVAGSAGPSIIGKPSAQSGTKPLPISAGRLRDKRLKKIKEGILQHNQEFRDVQERLNRERQRLHRVAVRYGLSTSLWTAISLMIPILLHEAEQVSGFLVYDCSQDQLKTQTIDLTAPKDCRDSTTDYHPARTTNIRVILTEGDMPVMATQCLVQKTQEVTRCGGHPSFHYGSFKVAINQPVEVPPQECRVALIAGKISVQGQKMDFKIGLSHYHQYYSEGGRTASGDCVITTFTRKGVTYQKSYEETTIQVLVTKVRGLKSQVPQCPDDDPPGFPDEGTLYQGIPTKMENRGQVVLQLPDCPRMQQGANSAQPHLRPHLPQHEGHLRRHQRWDPAQLPGPRKPAVATAGAMPGGRCACAGVHGPVQLPKSRDFGRTPGSDYHEEGCLCV